MHAVCLMNGPLEDALLSQGCPVLQIRQARSLDELRQVAMLRAEAYHAVRMRRLDSWGF
jgi:hypothetical protein